MKIIYPILMIMIGLISIGIVSSANLPEINIIPPPAPTTIVVDNSWNQSLTDGLYAGIEWDYNQSLATYTMWNAVWSTAGLDGNVSSICSDDEVLLGQDVKTCVGLNDTVSNLLTSTTYYPNNSAVIGGSYTDTSNISDAWYYDGVSLNFTEGGGVDPLDIYFNFTGVNDLSQIVIREYYLGSASHHIQVQIWDNVDSAWENYFDFVGQSGMTVLSIPIYDSTDHINGGNVSVRLHHVQNGISSHRLYVDFIWLIEGINIGASTNLEGYAKYSFDYNNFNGNGNFTTTGNVSATSLTTNNNVCNATSCFSLQDLNTTGSGGADNVTWNQSFASTLFWDINDGSYNATYLGSINNASYLSTYNATYNSFILNVSTNWTKRTYDTFNDLWKGGNASFNQTLTEGLYWALIAGSYNATYLGSVNNVSYLTTFNTTYNSFILNVSTNWTKRTYDTFNAIWSASGGNASWNQSFANTLYWDINDGSYNATYLSTFNATYDSFILNVSTNWTKRTYDTFNTIWSTAGLDGNVSSICSDDEVLLGQDVKTCIDLNATVDSRLSILDGSINSSAWNRSETNVILHNSGDKVGIGTIAPSSVLDVKGNASFNDTLFVSEKGYVGIGTAPSYQLHLVKTFAETTGTHRQVYFYSQFNPPSNSDANLYTMQVTATHSGSSDLNLIRLFNFIPTFSNTGTLGTAQLFNVQSTVDEAGTIDEFRSFSITHQQDDAGSLITDYYGLKIGLTNTSGTISNAYGLHIDMDGFAGENYGIYQSGKEEKSSFEGNISIGTNTTAHTFTVDGSTNITGSSYLNNITIGGHVNMTSNNITTVDCITFKSGGKICSGV